MLPNETHRKWNRTKILTIKKKINCNICLTYEILVKSPVNISRNQFKNGIVCVKSPCLYIFIIVIKKKNGIGLEENKRIETVKKICECRYIEKKMYEFRYKKSTWRQKSHKKTETQKWLLSKHEHKQTYTHMQTHSSEKKKHESSVIPKLSNENKMNTKLTITK